MAALPQSFDTNGDGKLQFEEFKHIASLRLSEADEQAIFERFDTDQVRPAWRREAACATRQPVSQSADSVSDSRLSGRCRRMFSAARRTG